MLFSLWYFDFIPLIKLLSILWWFYSAYFNRVAVRSKKVITYIFPNTSSKNGVKGGMIVAIAHWGFFEPHLLASEVHSSIPNFRDYMNG